ncbi:MAG: Fe-S-containing protein [Nanoarchaeota archaeon]
MEKKYLIGMVLLIMICFVILTGGVNNENNAFVEKENVSIKKENAYTQTTKFFGENGEEAILIDGILNLSVSTFDDNLAHYYHTELSSGKTVYFFVVKDSNGVYRAAANACQVCYKDRKGFSYQGNFMICNACGNKYPLEKIATEKGGCNPGPINPNLIVENGKITINELELKEIADLF